MGTELWCDAWLSVLAQDSISQLVTIWRPVGNSDAALGGILDL